MAPPMTAVPINLPTYPLASSNSLLSNFKLKLETSLMHGEVFIKMTRTRTLFVSELRPEDGKTSGNLCSNTDIRHWPCKKILCKCIVTKQWN